MRQALENSQGWDLVTGLVGHAEILYSFWKAKESYQSILSKRVTRLDEISYRKRILVAVWKIE